MKKLLPRLLIWTMILIISIPVQALAERKWFSIDGEEASICFQDGDKYTFVTPETLEENMELCLAHGGTEEAIRQRFGTGHVIWEAYRPDVDGRFRLEIYEDEWTHYVWDSRTASLKVMKSIGDDLLEAGWLADRYNFMTLFSKTTDESRPVKGKFLSQLPYDYESGIVTIHFYNGKAFVFLYCDSKPASVEGLWGKGVNEIMWGTLHWKGDYFRRDNKALANAPNMTDLLPDRSSLILNLHPGLFAMEGITEKGAAVTLENNGITEEAKISELKYKGSVTLTEGENKVTVCASKKGQPDNAIEILLPVDASMAALTLNQYPIGATDRDTLRIKGTTDPAGRITVTVDDGEPMEAQVQKDGSFDLPYEASDWEQHCIVITASQEGLNDYTARFSFTPTYQDAEKGIRAYRKTMDEQVLPRLLAADPAGYVGKRYSFEIKVKSWTVHDGMIAMEAQFNGNLHNYANDPFDLTIYLMFDGYVDDFFRPNQELTVFGEIIDPSITDPPHPRMQVQYAMYVIGGSRW